jgi:hypothetical protein
MQTNFSEMYAAAERQRLSQLYVEQVDANLFDDNCDTERDGTGLFFHLHEKRFLFVPYVTAHSGQKDTFLQFNAALFIAYVDAAQAAERELSQYVASLEDDQ